jgi:2-oxoglutarate ferredoxin oxidoreductase subunit delta
VKGRIEIDRERCKGCALCTTVCPKKQIEISEQLNTKGYYPAESNQEPEESQCTGCALCAVTCPDLAIEVYRERKDKAADGKDEPEE